MARAAMSADYRDEAAAAADPRACRACHAPGSAHGVTCRDCHDGTDPHLVADPVPTCGRCHDAPGETTVAAYADSTARRTGVDCRDCHSRRGRDHSFIGPSQPGFLDQVAQIQVMAVRQGNSHDLIIRIRHRAGHRLPGGTTGRAVWLRLSGRNADGSQVWREDIRFGWQQVQGDWQDHSLPADRPTTIRIDTAHRGRSHHVQAELVYRFSAGGLEQDDPRQVVLDTATLALP